MRLGTTPLPRGTRFAVRAPTAAAMWLCLFDAQDREDRRAMARDGDVWWIDVEGAGPGTRYGLRAAGAAPHDAAKLLVDPYAVALDRRFLWDAALTRPGAETAPLVPRAIVPAAEARPPAETIGMVPGGLIYELNVRGFTMLHPDVPAAQRGTIAALAHPAVVAHFRKLEVAAIELMPIVAWIDERHLPPLGLSNAWGYNPVVPMALDPRLCPGGIAEFRDTVAALHAAGVAVILDLVFNHTGESDPEGATLSLRGLDEAAYAHAPDGTLINDTGTGNTLDFGNPAVLDLTLSALRHFAALGVDGFRFDLAPILARSPGFDTDAPIFAAIRADPLLSTRLMIAEPWDIGPGGYQLGAFPADWLEWNDRFRDDVRRFWRGDGSASALATRLAGSTDIFGVERTRTVNFLAAHDGFTLADLTSYEHRRNEANGESNRDGHGDNLSWNCGVEAKTDDPAILACRDAYRRALLGTLFASRGTIMLTAGDEFARTQQGNNNAYAQDNPIGWVGWDDRDLALEEHVAGLARARSTRTSLSNPAIRHDLRWETLNGTTMVAADWHDPDCSGFVMLVDDLAVRIDRRIPGVTVTRTTD